MSVSTSTSTSMSMSMSVQMSRVDRAFYRCRAHYVSSPQRASARAACARGGGGGRSRVWCCSSSSSSSSSSADRVIAGTGLRRRSILTSAPLLMSSLGMLGGVRRASAEPSFPAGKLEVSTDELVSIIRADLVERQYLVNGNVSSNVYLDDCYFTDARDDFGPGLKKWQRGTSLLFVANKSFAELTGDVVFDPKTRTIEITKWRQQDYFRLPGTPHSPVFTGSVTLTLHPTFNLIARHDEKWDMDPDTITKQITF